MITPALLVLALSLATAVPSAAEESKQEKAVRAVVERYFAAVAAKDVEAVMSHWSRKSAGYAAEERAMKKLFAETGTLKVLRLNLLAAQVGEENASIRVKKYLTGLDARAGKTHPNLAQFDQVFHLVKEGDDWKLDRCENSVTVLLHGMLEAKDRAGRLRVMELYKDLAGPDFVQMLLKLNDYYAKGGDFERADPYVEIALEVADKLKREGLRARCYFYRGLSALYRSRHDAALRDLQQARRGFRAEGDEGMESAALNSIANVYQATGQYDEALRHYQESLTIIRRLGDANGEAAILGNLGALDQILGRYEQALRHFEESLTIFRRLADRKSEAGQLLNIGNIYQATGQYAEAMQKYQASFDIYRTLGDRLALAMPLNNMGLVCKARGEYEQALRYHRESLRINRILKDRQSEGGVLNNVGSVYEAMGQYAEALRLFRESLAIAREIGDRTGEARALNNIGLICSGAGQFAEAQRYYEDSLRLERDAGLRPMEASTLNNLGNVCESLGRPDEARRYHTACLKMAQALGDLHLAARAGSNLGNVHLDTRRFEDALQQFQETEQIARRLGDLSLEASARHGQGIACLGLGRYEDALRLFREALDLGRRVGNLKLAYASCQARGVLYQAEGQWRQSVEAYQEAIGYIESLREQTRDPSLQTSLFGQHAATYARLAECLLELGRPEDAFSVCERAKARTLVDVLAGGKANVRKGMTADEHRREQQLQDSLTSLGVRLEDRKTDAKQKQELARELTRQRQDYEAFRRDLFLRLPELQTRRAEFAPATLAGLNKALFAAQPKLAILSYLVADKEIILFVLTPGDKPDGPAHLAVHRIEFAAKDLAKDVEQFRAGCQKPRGGTPDGWDLYQRLLGPAEEQLQGASHIVLIPDGVLHELPFHALRDKEIDDADGRYLIERCAVSYAPSATALQEMVRAGQRRHTRLAAQSSLLVVGISDFGGREKVLPHAEAEARRVAELFGGRGQILLGAQATKARLKARWSDPRYLHFATHGRLDRDAPLYSAMVLTQAAGEEGSLYARELLDEDLPAELVVLSACNTGLGRSERGEGLLGLTWAWFVAGAPASIATQWSVADDSTERLMQVFYEALGNGVPKAEALRRAQRALLKDRQTRHPFFWAPFVFNGDPW